MPFGDQRLRLVVPRLCRVEERRGRVAVHQDLAGGQAQAEPFGLLEQGIDRLRMNRAVDAARGDSVAKIFLQEQPRDGARMCLVGELELGRESVFVQPVEKLGAVTGDHRRLRIMDVGVDEARRNERVPAVVDNLGACRQQRRDAARRPEVGDFAVGHGHDGVGLVNHRGVEAVAEGIAGEGERRAAHGRHSSGRSDHFRFFELSCCRRRARTANHVRIENRRGKGAMEALRIDAAVCWRCQHQYDQIPWTLRSRFAGMVECFCRAGARHMNAGAGPFIPAKTCPLPLDSARGAAGSRLERKVAALGPDPWGGKRTSPPSRRPSQGQQCRRPTGAPGTLDPMAATKERNDVCRAKDRQVRANHTVRSGGPAGAAKWLDLQALRRSESPIPTSSLGPFRTVGPNGWLSLRY